MFLVYQRNNFAHDKHLISAISNILCKKTSLLDVLGPFSCFSVFWYFFNEYEPNPKNLDNSFLDEILIFHIDYWNLKMQISLLTILLDR